MTCNADLDRLLFAFRSPFLRLLFASSRTIGEQEPVEG
jgi:hypothetical protein